MAISEINRQELLALAKDGSLTKLCRISESRLCSIIEHGSEEEIIQIIQRAELLQALDRHNMNMAKLRGQEQ